MAAITPKTVSPSPLLLLLDGILSQDIAATDAAMLQIGILDPQLTQYLAHHRMDSPIQSAQSLEIIVETLMTRFPHLAHTASDGDGSLPLHFAASIGNIRVASLLLSANKDAALRHNTKGKIPLHYAAREGRIEMVRFLLQIVPQCASVLTKKKKLAIHFAAGEGHVDVVRALLQVHPEGAIIPSKKGKVALHFAARWGHMGIARDLLSVRPESIQVLDGDGSTPLHDACREGQLEMAQYLVHIYPHAMTVSNDRGEVPLFSAIRSGAGSGQDAVVDLCSFLVRSWPMSGSIVIQGARVHDTVQDWDPAVLELCLRGAANNFTHGIETSVVAATLSTPAPPVYQPYNNDSSSGNKNDTSMPLSNCHMAYLNQPDSEMVSNPRNALWSHLDAPASASDHSSSRNDVATTGSYTSDRTVSEPPHEQDYQVNHSDTVQTCNETHMTSLHINLPRSKSPILDSETSHGKRRSGADGTNDNKRPRRGSVDGDVYHDESCICCSGSNHNSVETVPFQKLHTALQCGASSSVLSCVLDQCDDSDIRQVDDLGRLPLHLAAQRCAHPEAHNGPSAAFSSTMCAEEREERAKLVKMIQNKIWARYTDACFKRDYLGRLPIHLALTSRSDCRIIRLLLDANPSSGVEHCDTVELRYMEKLPIHVASECDCDLSTMYMLLRVDPTVVKTWEREELF